MKCGLSDISWSLILDQRERTFIREYLATNHIPMMTLTALRCCHIGLYQIPYINYQVRIDNQTMQQLLSYKYRDCVQLQLTWMFFRLCYFITIRKLHPINSVYKGFVWSKAGVKTEILGRVGSLFLLIIL